MIAWWLLSACSFGPDVPDGVPPGASHFWVRDGSLMIDDAEIAPLSSVDADPLEESDPSLVKSLSVGNGAVWFELPPDTPFHLVRRVVNSARAAGRGPLVISASGSSGVHPLVDPASYGLGSTCTEGAYTVRGVTPLLTISLQTGRDGAWLLGSARFLPVVSRYGDVGPVDGLPSRCLEIPPCENLFGANAESVEACRAGEAHAGGRTRAALGGATGCMAQIASEPSEVVEWEGQVSEVVASLGLADQPLVMVMPEARARLDALLALMRGFEAAGTTTPAVGTTLLIEGNDGPPMCNAPVRDAASLEAAGARWIGTLRGASRAQVPSAQ